MPEILSGVIEPEVVDEDGEALKKSSERTMVDFCREVDRRYYEPLSTVVYNEAGDAALKVTDMHNGVDSEVRVPIVVDEQYKKEAAQIGFLALQAEEKDSSPFNVRLKYGYQDMARERVEACFADAMGRVTCDDAGAPLKEIGLYEEDGYVKELSDEDFVQLQESIYAICVKGGIFEQTEDYVTRVYDRAIVADFIRAQNVSKNSLGGELSDFRRSAGKPWWTFLDERGIVECVDGSRESRISSRHREADARREWWHEHCRLRMQYAYMKFVLRANVREANAQIDRDLRRQIDDLDEALDNLTDYSVADIKGRLPALRDSDDTRIGIQFGFPNLDSHPAFGAVAEASALAKESLLQNSASVAKRHAEISTIPVRVVGADMILAPPPEGYYTWAKFIADAFLVAIPTDRDLVRFEAIAMKDVTADVLGCHGSYGFSRNIGTEGVVEMPTQTRPEGSLSSLPTVERLRFVAAHERGHNWIRAIRYERRRRYDEEAPKIERIFKGLKRDRIAIIGSGENRGKGMSDYPIGPGNRRYWEEVLCEGIAFMRVNPNLLKARHPESFRVIQQEIMEQAAVFE